MDAVVPKVRTFGRDLQFVKRAQSLVEGANPLVFDENNED